VNDHDQVVLFVAAHIDNQRFTWFRLLALLLSMLLATEATRDGRVLPREDEIPS